MTPQLWSWALAAIGIAGIFLAGRPRLAWLGWTVGFTAQALWIAYAVATGQYGFIFSALGYGTVYGLNVRRALAARQPRQDTPPEEATGPSPADPTGALGPNTTPCPICPDHRRVANPLLDGHLYRHHLRGQQ